jgi:hypothetical protein
MLTCRFEYSSWGSTLSPRAKFDFQRHPEQNVTIYLSTFIIYYYCVLETISRYSMSEVSIRGLEDVF